MKLKVSKKWIITGVSVLAAAGIGTGIFAVATKGGSKPVYVYNFDVCGMTDYWGDRQSTSGLVRADNIQTVMLTDTQTITGVEVKEGDHVKKGDLLVVADLDKIKESGRETITPMIICNSDAYEQVETFTGKDVETTDAVMKLHPAK